MVSVDGDTSTNDTVLLLANGLAENPEITEKGEDYQIFKAALNYINTTPVSYTHLDVYKRQSFHMGPHANYTCPSPTLKEIIDVAKELNLPIHLHVSEEDVQVEKAREETGLTPFGILYEAGGFDCKVLIGHGLWIRCV